ncbi:uncharacterized protein STEHIDRAFT_154367 [Stereum hirsutum FP-91666 SS1]|uniref:uncharacterized protein n=1 Tax=Stereum hirsutum (strain FP-91666) TaxID=721885 RepID=UPI0004409FBB|nr:uncharacterized protein STEHIDRAFT_154367 [Stereum hirsutum FP-91666 SS1]EIM90553.1 hypothetical protein STEHIDRAFT_154367 [Stereum hirsutum FP-91666 SS1]
MFVSISLLSWPSKAVLGEVDKGGWEGSQLNGPDFIQTKLANRLVLPPRVYFRDIVRKIMLEDNPGGFDAYYPGKHNAWSPCSGYGEIGLPAYAFKDKWPDELLFMEVIWNAACIATALAHLYLDFIERYGGTCIHLSLRSARAFPAYALNTESPKSFTLLPQELNRLETSSIVDKRDPVGVPVAGGREETFEIAMDEIERIGKARR